MNALRRLHLRLAVPPTPFRMNPRLDQLVEDLCRKGEDGARVLNLGAGSASLEGRVVNLDIERFAGVHVCGDGEALPFRAGTFAAVLLRGVLEHVRSADRVLEQTRCVLRPRGLIYVEVPFLQPFHSSPEDHRRFTLNGIRAFLSGFEEIEAGVQIGPGSTLAWISQEALAALLAFGSVKAYVRIRALLGWATFWLKHLDRLVVPAPFVANSASALYFLGRKRG